MGLAINGKIIQSSGLTYINQNSKKVDTGYINVDGTTNFTSGFFLSLFDLVAPGTYLTDLDTLQKSFGLFDFMDDYYGSNDDVKAKEPVLIHVPENNLVKYDNKNILNLLAYFCYLTSYYDVDKSKQNNNVLGKIINKLNTKDLMSAGMIQPREDDLDNFTFSIAGGSPMPAIDLFNTNVDSIVDCVYYRGRQVEFYHYAGTDINNVSNRMIIYLAGGYGVSVIPDYAKNNNYDPYVYMKLSDPNKDGVINIYTRSNYHIQINKGLTDTNHKVSFDNYSDNHGYTYPVYFNANSDGTYDAYLLAFSQAVMEENKALSLNSINALLATDVPYNPHLFYSIFTEYDYITNGFATDFNIKLLTLAKNYDLNNIGSLNGTAVTPNRINASYKFSVYLPLGRYKLDRNLPLGETTSSVHIPISPSKVDYFEVKKINDNFIEQRIYVGATGDSNAYYYRLGKITSDGVKSYSSWHSSFSSQF